MTDETARWVTLRLTESDLDLIAAVLTQSAEAHEKLWKSPHAVPRKLVERAESCTRLAASLDAAWEVAAPSTAPAEPAPDPVNLPTLSEEVWEQTVAYNGRVGDLTGAEERDYVERTRNPQGPGLGDSERFNEVTIAEDRYSHGIDSNGSVTWCGKQPVGILPKPTGIYCPDCYGHNGMN